MSEDHIEQLKQECERLGIVFSEIKEILDAYLAEPVFLFYVSTLGRKDEDSSLVWDIVVIGTTKLLGITKYKVSPKKSPHPPLVREGTGSVNVVVVQLESMTGYGEEDLPDRVQVFLNYGTGYQYTIVDKPQNVDKLRAFVGQVVKLWQATKRAK